MHGIFCVTVAGLLSLPCAAEAQFKKWVDDQGRVHYSNVRPPTRAPKGPGKSVKSSVDPEALIKELLEISGAKAQIAQIPAAVQAQLTSQKREMTPADHRRLSHVIAEAYRPDLLYETVAERLKGRFDERRFASILRTLRTPLFKKISQLELEASTPDAAQRVKDFAAQLAHRPPPESRVALVQRVDAAAGVSALQLEIMLDTVRGIIQAMEQALPPEKRLSTGQLNWFLSSMLLQARRAVREQVSVHLLYAYGSLADKELERYLRFLESDHGRWFARVSREALAAAMRTAAERAGRQMRLMLRTRGAAADGHSSHPTSDAQRSWALAASALLTERSGQRHDVLGGTERTPENIRKWTRVMEQRWGIHDRADLFATLKWLDEGGHRQDFEKIGAFVDSLSETQYREVLARARWDPAAWYQFRMVKRYHRPLGSKSLLGWDYARYIALCRWGYLVGYLSEDEAWERIMPAARILQAAFDSWEDLAKNYLIGGMFWPFRESQTDRESSRDAYVKLLNDPESPWRRYSWEMNLDDGLETVRGRAALNPQLERAR